MVAKVMLVGHDLEPIASWPVEFLAGGVPIGVDLVSAIQVNINLAAAALALGTYMGEVGNTPYSETDRVIRPANVTQYTAGDVVGDGTVMEFDIARAVGGGGWINNAVLLSTATPASTGQFIAWVFTAVPTVAADNSPFAPTDGEMQLCVCTIMFDMARKTVSNTLYQQSDPRAPYFKCGVADTNLYVVLTDGNAYTPVSGEQFQLTLYGTKE